MGLDIAMHLHICIANKPTEAFFIILSINSCKFEGHSDFYDPNYRFGLTY